MSAPTCEKCGSDKHTVYEMRKGAKGVLIYPELLNVYEADGWAKVRVRCTAVTCDGVAP